MSEYKLLCSLLFTLIIGSKTWAHIAYKEMEELQELGDPTDDTKDFLENGFENVCPTGLLRAAPKGILKIDNEEKYIDNVKKHEQRVQYETCITPYKEIKEKSFNTDVTRKCTPKYVQVRLRARKNPKTTNNLFVVQAGCVCTYNDAEIN